MPVRFISSFFSFSMITYKIHLFKICSNVPCWVLSWSVNLWGMIVCLSVTSIVRPFFRSSDGGHLPGCEWKNQSAEATGWEPLRRQGHLHAEPRTRTGDTDLISWSYEANGSSAHASSSFSFAYTADEWGRASLQNCGLFHPKVSSCLCCWENHPQDLNSLPVKSLEQPSEFNVLSFILMAIGIAFPHMELWRKQYRRKTTPTPFIKSILRVIEHFLLYCIIPYILLMYWCLQALQCRRL